MNIGSFLYDLIMRFFDSLILCIIPFIVALSSKKKNNSKWLRSVIVGIIICTFISFLLYLFVPSGNDAVSLRGAIPILAIIGYVIVFIVSGNVSNNENKEPKDILEKNDTAIQEIKKDKVPSEQIEYKERPVEIVPVQTKNHENAKPNPSIKKRFCKYCGAIIDSETNACTGCGKKIFFPIKKKSIIIASSYVLIACALVGVVCGIVALTRTKNPEEDEYTVSQYNTACNLDYSGKFEEAADIFLSIGYYKDSSEKYVESMISYSTSLIESHDFEKAYGVLQNLRSSGSCSDGLIDDCCVAAGDYYNDEKSDFLAAYEWYKKANNQVYVGESIDIVLKNMYNSIQINMFEDMCILKYLNSPTGISKSSINTSNETIRKIIVLQENNYADTENKLQKYLDLIH